MSPPHNKRRPSAEQAGRDAIWAAAEPAPAGAYIGSPAERWRVRMAPEGSGALGAEGVVYGPAPVRETPAEAQAARQRRERLAAAERLRAGKGASGKRRRKIVL